MYLVPSQRNKRISLDENSGITIWAAEKLPALKMMSPFDSLAPFSVDRLLESSFFCHRLKVCRLFRCLSISNVKRPLKILSKGYSGELFFNDEALKKHLLESMYVDATQQKSHKSVYHMRGQ